MKSREEWFLKELEKTPQETLPTEDALFILEEVREVIEDNRIELDELKLHLDNYDDK